MTINNEQRSTKHLIDFVTERPTRENLMPRRCPFCAAEHLVDRGCQTTLLGRLAGEGYDANHIWQQYTCNGCGEKFSHEQRCGWHWLVRTADQKIITGMPYCYEHYLYTHKGCGGDVKRRYTQLDGVTTVTIPLPSYTADATCGLADAKHRTFFDCTRCGASIETEEDYHRPTTIPML